MRTVLRKRYYCDHCKKSGGSAPAMMKHESACTANPQRDCRMCRNDRAEQDGGNTDTVPPSTLLAILIKDGFQAMADAALHCPACILSALRLEYDPNPDHQSAHDDGRYTFDYRKAVSEWWKERPRDYGYPPY